jgi:hypothetical protein
MDQHPDTWTSEGVKGGSNWSTPRGTPPAGLIGFLCHLRLRPNAENSGWNSPGTGVTCRYGQIHRGVDTGPGDRRADRIFQTITIGLMFPGAARPIAVDGTPPGDPPSDFKKFHSEGYVPRVGGP